MSYLGRRGAASPLTSGDIPADVVQGTDIAYLENDSTTQNLGGTYSTERMYLNDSYTLNDDVTVTGHLALGSIADSDVVITNDSSARTITGSGTIESGRLMNDTQSSLTGMTGELGSTVTGSPALNLRNVTGSSPNRHYFLATKTANQTVNNNTCVLVTWDIDVYSSWDGSKGLDLTNNYWICPETGYYWLYFMHRLTDGDDAGGGQIWVLTKNQTITAAAQSTLGHHLFGSLVDEDAAYIPNATNGQVCQLSSGDIIRFYCTNNHGTNESIQAGSDGWYQTKFGGYILR